MPAAKMNLPLTTDGIEDPSWLPATKKERIVVLGMATPPARWWLNWQQNKREDRQRPVNPDDARLLMELSYDKLVYAIGTGTGTFGVPGVRENCYMLKEASDARLLRAAIVNVLEEACLAGMTDEGKEKLLFFVGKGYCGAPSQNFQNFRVL
ncbi:unnamed protein product [Ectocarpus sp. CCAP 1310/34]|nr:unnamed protein product [Ectocarpus sp. CCAP 1310/34]